MRPHPRRARVNPSSPRAWATSDRDGMIGNHENMLFQYEWAGTELINRRLLVHHDELDTPQQQLRTIFIPPDPPPIMQARPEQYSMDEDPVSTRVTSKGDIRSVRNGRLFSQRIVNG